MNTVASFLAIFSLFAMDKKRRTTWIFILASYKYYENITSVFNVILFFTSGYGILKPIFYSSAPPKPNLITRMRYSQALQYVNFKLIAFFILQCLGVSFPRLKSSCLQNRILQSRDHFYTQTFLFFFFYFSSHTCAACILEQSLIRLIY